MGRHTAIAFAVGSVCGVAATWAVTNYACKQNLTANNDKLSDEDQSQTTPRQTPRSAAKESSSAPSLPPDLRDEQLSRHALYFGDEGMKNVRNSKVCVVGLGGVGSHTALMLARGGVETLRLIDFDQVTLSSLNRHACATLKDVGIPKVKCVQETCRQLGLSNVDARVQMYNRATGPSLLEGQPWDVVIDCIDDVPTKAVLLAYCIRHKIRVLSCMGAGGKSDMTRLHVSDLRTAAKDPLASKLRQTLKREMKNMREEDLKNQSQKTELVDDSYLDDMDQLSIIYSSEMTVCKLADFTEEQQQQRDKSQFGAVDGMRIRVLPVLGPLPAIMGQSLAALALCELGQKPILQPVTGERVSRNVRNRMYQHLRRREELIENKTLEGDAVPKDDNVWSGPLEVEQDDIDFLLGVWRNKCAVTGGRLGNALDFVRWDWSKPSTCDNLVLLSGETMKQYDNQGKSFIPENIRTRIERRLASCREVNLDW